MVYKRSARSKTALIVLVFELKGISNDGINLVKIVYLKEHVQALKEKLDKILKEDVREPHEVIELPRPKINLESSRDHEHEHEHSYFHKPVDDNIYILDHDYCLAPLFEAITYNTTDLTFFFLFIHKIFILYSSFSFSIKLYIFFHLL